MTKAMVHSDPRRVRNSRACNYCRENKGRCDGEPPVNKPGEVATIQENPCSRCRSMNHVCEWVPSRRKGRAKRPTPEMVSKSTSPAGAAAVQIRMVEEEKSSEEESYGSLENTDVYKLFPSVFAPVEVMCSSPEGSLDEPQCEPVIHLPVLSELLGLLTNCLEPLPPLSPKHSVLGPPSELLELIDVFYSHGHHILRILPSRDVFLAQHCEKVSPFLLASICAFAQPFYDGPRGISTDYFSLAEFLFAEERSDTPDLEKIIGDIFLVHVGYGYATAASVNAHMDRAAAVALANNIYKGSFAILDRRQEGQAQFDRETLKRTALELFHANLDAQYTIGGRGCAFAPFGVKPVEMLEHWAGEKDEMLSFSLRTAALCVLHLTPPSSDKVHQNAQFHSLESQVTSLMSIAEERWFKLARTVSSSRKAETCAELYSREGYFYSLHSLATMKIHLYHYYKFPDVSLNFKICSLEPDGEYDSIDTLRSLTLHTPPPPPAECGVISETTKKPLSLQPVPFLAIEKLVTTAQGTIALMRETARIQREQEMKSRSGSPPHQDQTNNNRVHSNAKVGVGEIHSPFLVCCHIISAFALLIGVISLIQVTISQPEVLLGDVDMRRSMHLRILAFVSELDCLEEFLDVQGKVWPIAQMKLRRLRECRKAVMDTFEETLQKIGPGIR
ncbi:hypothetical protein BT69DRAFT_1277649 [Atractiella rhizophila]|nr:hypothetical protein BT69DRAFT_1277649 [Atractiella rhizophila]